MITILQNRFNPVLLQVTVRMGARKVPYELLYAYEKQAKAIYDGNEAYNTKIAKIA